MIMKYIHNIFKLLLLAFIIFANESVIAQKEEIIEEEVVENDPIVKEERRIISLTELAEIMNSDKTEITIYNYKIVSKEEDQNLALNKFFFQIFEIVPSRKKAIEQILFHDCIFDLNEKDYLVFKEWNIDNIKIIGCVFNNLVAFENIYSEDKPSFFIENCFFHDQIRIANNKSGTRSIEFINNDFSTDVLIELKLEKLMVDTCRFTADTGLFNSRAEVRTFYQLEVLEYPIDNVVLRKNVFDNKGLTDLFSINFASAEFEELKIISNHMQTMNLSGAEVKKTLLIDSLFVDDYIGILNFDFPEDNTNASWYNLGGEKLSIFTIEEKLIIAYQAKTDKQLSENLKYNDLISAYNKFNTLYHNRGDITSANASYVEIKDIETRKQALIQKVNPSSNNLINYKLNQFLRFFSDYATNPGKSLKQSIYVILFFAFWYIFTFSDWDKVTLRFFTNEFNIFNNFTKYKKDISIYLILEEERERLKEEDAELISENSKATQKNPGKKVSRFDKLFSEPIYFIGKFRYNIIPGLLRFVGFSVEPWKEHGIFEKAKSGVLLILIALVFILYVVIVRIFVSVMLSLNSFVVIGFGSLPNSNKSIAMYLTIIEGIIGWFLLMIFTITLLSQVLQNT